MTASFTTVAATPAQAVLLENTLLLLHFIIARNLFTKADMSVVSSRTLQKLGTSCMLILT